jgi:hypothetical protein
MTSVALAKSGKVKIYASPKIDIALREITKDMGLYHGVRLAQVLEAVYVQGMKDGARRAFARLDEGMTQAKREIAHRIPGRPKKL